MMTEVIGILKGNTIRLGTSVLHKTKRALLQLLTGSQGGSLGNTMEGEVEVGAAAATDTSVHSLAGAACGDMAVDKQTQTWNAT